MKDLLRTSVNASLVVQWVTMIANVIGVILPIKPGDFVVQQALYIETFVQAIQLTFYSWFKNHIVDKPAVVTKFRYYDWVITTPLMLFTTIVFYAYNNQSEAQKDAKPLTLEQFVRDNLNVIVLIFVANLLMLLFGYLAEIGVLGLVSSTIWGFLALAVSFGTMWYNFVKDHPQNNILYYFMLFIWSLYGVAAVLTPTWKNVSYNILDVFSKNFYGVFLTYFLLTRV
jgi:hypothetical protein